MRYALIVDDQPMVSGLLKSVLEQRDFVCEVAADVAGARHLLQDFDADIVLVDLHLGGGPSGFDLAHYVAKNFPHMAILAMTQFSAPELIDQDKSELPESASFISKTLIADSAALFSAVESAINSETAVHTVGEQSPLSQLTPTQVQVLRMLAAGYRTSEIAAARGKTTSAVEQTITHIYRNLGIEDVPKLNQRAEAMRIFIANAGLPQRVGAE